ncbi:hypothetical protein [Hypericibacter sp.]|uniref:hypothetical protein n=1 Tax=Hypericibacter sp. TaxID=2705401 RepID=UPI003D6CC133
MTSLPIAGYFANAVRSVGEMKQAFEDQRNFIAQLIGGAQEVQATIAGDSITPASGVIKVETEAGAGTDNLATIVQTNLPDGSLLMLRPLNAAHVVVVKNAAGGGGQILTANAADFSMNSTKMWLLLKRTGTNWEEVARFYGDQLSAQKAYLGISGSYAAKTAAYNVVAADNGSVLDWTTAGFSANLLAAATAGAGFTLTLVNSAASGDVTIDPNGAETIDGLTTRLMRPGDEVTIYCTGAAWKTLRGQYSYDSGEQTITAAGALTLAHGLGAKPQLRDVFLRCKTAEGGYSIGDEVVWPTGELGTAASSPSIVIDATNISVRYGSSMFVINKGTGASFGITVGNWRAVFRASILK